MIKNRFAILNITRNTGFLIKKTPDSETVFSIVNLINKSNKSEDIYYNIGDELREFDIVRIQPEQRVRKFDKTDNRRPTPDRGREKQRDSNGQISKSRDSFHDKKENNKPYTTTRIKSRNFLSNISYVG